MTTMNLTHTNMVPGWIKAIQTNLGSIENPETHGTVLTEQELAAFRAHPQVKERVQRGREHISSFNYLRDVEHQDMDSLSIRARGLYINTQTREIVIRGYDKTTQINEPGLAKANFVEVLQSTTAPYTTSVIENGFLGLAGYDRQTDEVVFATKSIIDPQYHEWAQRHIRGTMTPERYESFKAVLRECQLTLAFEVIEPHGDPHIIENSRSKLVLLDGIRNSLDFERITISQLDAIGEMFDFECRAIGPSLSSKKQLAEFVIGATKNGYRHDTLDGLVEIEGLMIEDAKGNMIKLKLPFYEMWKACRSAMEALSSKKPKSRTHIPQHQLSHPGVTAFVEWFKAQDPAPARTNIIAARRAFLADHPQMVSPSYEGFSLKAGLDAEALTIPR